MCVEFFYVVNIDVPASVGAPPLYTQHIKKARRSFFLFGSIGVYQGNLNLLSAQSVVEVCVMPVLMYGLENWILNVTTTALLEYFLTEMGRRILKLPK